MLESKENVLCNHAVSRWLMKLSPCFLWCEVILSSEINYLWPKELPLAFLERPVFGQSVLQFVFIWGFVNVSFVIKRDI